jgi:hypothetical protein
MSEILSALTDGQASPDEVAAASAAWRDDVLARTTWHRYQLIGDALRSPELLQASDGAAFLRSFRARLAEEAVVLAPQPMRVAPVGSSEANVVAGNMGQSLNPRPWFGPAAVAASFVLLIGLLASNLPGSGIGESRHVEAMAALQKPAWTGLSDNDLGLAAASLNSPMNSSFTPLLSSADEDRAQDHIQWAQSVGASFARTDQTEDVFIRDSRVEPLLSMQRPMVIEPVSTSFASPGHIR